MLKEHNFTAVNHTGPRLGRQDALRNNVFKGQLLRDQQPGHRTHGRLVAGYITTTKGFAASVFSQVTFTVAGPRAELTDRRDTPSGFNESASIADRIIIIINSCFFLHIPGVIMIFFFVEVLGHSRKFCVANMYMGAGSRNFRAPKIL